MNRWIHMLFVGLGIGFVLAIVGFPTQKANELGPRQGFTLLDPELLSSAAYPFGMKEMDGEQIRLGDLKGQYVVLNFWATWCEPCLQELPHLARLANHLKGRPVKLLLVSEDEDFKAIAAFIKEIEKGSSVVQAPEKWQETGRMLEGKFKNVSILLDEGQRVSKRYGSFKFPETYLIDPEGMLRVKFTGPKLWGQRYALEFLDGLIAINK